MKKPTVCFLGNRCKSYEIMSYFNASIKSVYIDGKNNNEEIISFLKPDFICFILEKRVYGHGSIYSAALDYSKRTLCPVYAICSQDQFYGIKNHWTKSVIHRVTELGFYRIVRNTIRLFRESSDGRTAVIKSRFDTVAVISSDAVSSAYAENQVCRHNTPYRRIRLSSPSSPETSEILKDKESYSGFIVTEPLNAIELEKISLELSKVKTTSIPVIILENNKHYNIKGNFRYLNIKDNDDEISNTLSRAYITKFKRISFRKSEDDENTF